MRHARYPLSDCASRLSTMMGMVVGRVGGSARTSPDAQEIEAWTALRDWSAPGATNLVGEL
jgi:hypothetical protein